MTRMKNIGAFLNGAILRRRLVAKIDLFLEFCFSKFPQRESRRYKSYIGNYLISNAKRLHIEKYSSKINEGGVVVDIGCADGSLLFCLQDKYDNKYFGFDSGYAELYSKQSGGLRDITFTDIDIYHPHYSPNGKNHSNVVTLGLPQNVDLVIMYDVVPYLDIETQENYLKQIGFCLKSGGQLILTLMLETDSGVVIAGDKGEAYQSTTKISHFLKIAEKCNLVLVDVALGNWDSTRRRWDIGDIDLLVLKKL
jgi:SAM-dependent methyltransferase